MLHTWLCIYVHMCEVMHTCKLHLNRLTQNGVFPVVGGFDWQAWRGLADKPAVTASATLKRQMNISAWMLEFYCFCNVHKLSKRPFYALHFPAPVTTYKVPSGLLSPSLPSLSHSGWAFTLPLSLCFRNELVSGVFDYMDVFPYPQRGSEVLWVVFCGLARVRFVRCSVGFSLSAWLLSPFSRDYPSEVIFFLFLMGHLSILLPLALLTF